MVNTRGAFLGAGKVYFDVYDASGNKTGELEIGDAESFVINDPKVEKKELKSFAPEDYGQVIASVNLGFDQDMSMIFRRVNRGTLAVALFGADSPFTQAAQSVPAEAVKVRHDRYVKLANRGLGQPVAVTPAATDISATYTENTDYVVDRAVGRILALSSGAIDDQQTVKVAYSAGAVSGYTVKANTQTEVYVYIRMIGVNKVTREPVEVVVEKVSLDPSGIDWLSGDFLKLTIKGKLISTSGGIWSVTVLSA